MIQHNDYSLLKHNTFGIDAKAKCFVEYASEEELTDFLAQHQGEKKLHIGEGSNLLFTTSFYEGIVLHSAIRTLEIVERDTKCVVVRVGGGWNWDEFVAYSLQQGWYGLENLSLIPGEVGASAVQNIGAYGREAGDFIVSANCIHLETGEKRTFTHDELHYGYRTSLLKQPEYRGKWAVITVDYRLSQTFSPLLTYGGIETELSKQGIAKDMLTAMQLRQVIIDIRRAKLPDPREIGSAGSFFMNPVVERERYEQLADEYPNMPHYDVDSKHVKIPAGWMIEQCGWKGKHVGKCGVHDKQALVLVNYGGATGEEIVALCDAVRRSVADKFHIDIHPEVNFIQ